MAQIQRLEEQLGETQDVINGMNEAPTLNDPGDAAPTVPTKDRLLDAITLASSPHDPNADHDYVAQNPLSEILAKSNPLRQSIDVCERSMTADASMSLVAKTSPLRHQKASVFSQNTNQP